VYFGSLQREQGPPLLGLQGSYREFINCRPMTPSPNLFADIPSNLPEELFSPLLDTSSIRIERIVSYGQASPEGFWYDQDQHEWVIVLKGAARLRLEDGIVEMRPGDFINLPAHKKHRVEWTTPHVPTIWLAIYYGG
jgi:cupin 2 domain-containing protein